MVRLVGVEDPFEVLCETSTTMVLINPSARLRQQVSDLEDKLSAIKRQLAEITSQPSSDTGGVPMDNP